MPSESAFSSHWFGVDEAVERLTYEHDRGVVRGAVELVRGEVRRREEELARSGCLERIGLEGKGATVEPGPGPTAAATVS